MKRIPFIVLLCFYFATAKAQTSQPEYFAELKLEDTSGAIFNTNSLKGKVVYVDFWFTACPPCVSEIPYSQALQQFFAKDTNVVFLNICIENLDRKSVWKQMVESKAIKGIHLFYPRNRPQTVNLLRVYNIKFPTYILLDNQSKVISYDMPRPSETGWVYWLLTQASKGVTPHEASTNIETHYEEYKQFMTNLKAALPAGFVEIK